MGKRLASVLRIGLSTTGITLLHTSGWLRSRSEVLADCRLSEEEAAAPALLAAKLQNLLRDAQCERFPARIVLADSWVRSWVVIPPQNAVHFSDCEVAAAARFQALYSESLTNWHMTADWDARRPFLACAIPRVLLAALNQVASECKLVLLETAPQFVVSWNRWHTELNAGAWFATLHENVMTIAAISQRRLSAVRAVTLSPEAVLDQNCLPKILALEALRLNLPMPSDIQLCGQIPLHWTMPEVGALNCTRLDVDIPEQGVPMHAGAMLAAAGMRP